MDDSQSPPRSDWIPRPDPTVLTTEQLRRELLNLRELIETRLNGMDKSMDLILHTADKVPADVHVAVMHLKSLHEERFQRIDIQLRERDGQAEQWRREGQIAVNTALAASKEAVGAALQAAKEAVSKTELAFTKSLDQLGIQSQTEIRALDGKMSEMKDRLEASIASVSARSEASIIALRAELLPQISGERSRGDVGAGRQMGQGAMIAVIFAAISAFGVIIGIIAFISKSSVN